MKSAWRRRSRSHGGAEAASRRSGAGDGNRTHVYSLEGCRSTIELRPLGVGSRWRSTPRRRRNHELEVMTLCVIDHDVAVAGHVLRVRRGKWWGEQDSNLRRRCHQIYSLTPLAAREPPQGDKDPSVIQCARKRLDDQADLDSDAGCRYQCRTPIKLSPTGALLPCHPVRIPL